MWQTETRKEGNKWRHETCNNVSRCNARVFVLVEVKKMRPSRTQVTSGLEPGWASSHRESQASRVTPCSLGAQRGCRQPGGCGTDRLAGSHPRLWRSNVGRRHLRMRHRRLNAGSYAAVCACMAMATLSSTRAVGWRTPGRRVWHRARPGCQSWARRPLLSVRDAPRSGARIHVTSSRRW